MSLSTESTTSIKAIIDTGTADPTLNVPGTIFCVVVIYDRPIFSHASGKRSTSSSQPMTLDTIFWIASCTKMIGGIACMQLVEQGKLSLDDGNLAEEICPELKDVKIFEGKDNNGKPILVEKKNRINLRMLLSHTAGFGYSFFSPEIKSWSMPIGVNEFSGRPSDILSQPLLFEPGTNSNYGVGIDWAGLMVERVPGLHLNDYFQKFIFAPLGIKNISMFPTPEMREKLAGMHFRNPSGKLEERDHLQRIPLLASDEEATGIFKSAGAGCFASPLENLGERSSWANIIITPTDTKRRNQKSIDGVQTVEVIVNNAGPEWVSAPGVEVTIDAPGITVIESAKIVRLRPGDQKKVDIKVTGVGHVAAKIILSGANSTSITTFQNVTFGLRHWTEDASSLTSHESPNWFNDAKFGIFIHWGVYSVPSWGNSTPWEVYAEWYWWYGHHLIADKADIYDYHLRTYGPEVVYDDFFDNFTAAAWDPKEWVDLFDEAGAQYFVLTTKYEWVILDNNNTRQ